MLSLLFIWRLLFRLIYVLILLYIVILRWPFVLLEWVIVIFVIVNLCILLFEMIWWFHVVIFINRFMICSILIFISSVDVILRLNFIPLTTFWSRRSLSRRFLSLLLLLSLNLIWLLLYILLFLILWTNFLCLLIYLDSIITLCTAHYSKIKIKLNRYILYF